LIGACTLGLAGCRRVTKLWLACEQKRYAGLSREGRAILMAHVDGPVTIKQYAAQRLYDTRAARYVSLDDLAEMVEDDEDFIVTDAKSGDDITQSVLKQIIVERGRHG
jgi:hypothetical protein